MDESLSSNQPINIRNNDKEEDDLTPPEFIHNDLDQINPIDGAPTLPIVPVPINIQVDAQPVIPIIPMPMVPPIPIEQQPVAPPIHINSTNPPHNKSRKRNYDELMDVPVGDNQLITLPDLSAQ